MTIQNPNAVRLKEHPYIEFINNVQMASSGTDISGTALFNNEGKGFNNQITMRDIITNYIYPNTLAVLRVTGQDLREALEQSATYFVLEKANQFLTRNMSIQNHNTIIMICMKALSIRLI